MRRHGRTHALAAGTAALALTGTLSGCGLVSGSPMSDKVSPGKVGAGQPLKGAQLTVTSKEFTEQVILGKIMGLVFRAAGADVVDRTAVQGSIGARSAVESGTADGMYEYTGTSWITYLGHTKPVTDPVEQWKAVRKEDRANGLEWLAPSELDNTYALVISDKLQKKYGIRTLSDVAELSRKQPNAASVCVENEFASRQDGLPGMAKKYGMRFPSGQVHKMAGGVVYTQTAKGKPCTFGAIAATDGRIPALKLKIIEDDRKFFPNYNVAPEMNAGTMKEHPEIAGLLAPITKALNNKMAQKLNAKVDVEGQDPHDVAKDWLVREGFIKTG
ncbi:glycine betaine ABC transporter substrate-binding protein [Streptomyces abyssalis]|uniref:glycine betaine ABC transporter substrate-binding protein n=1 Tax=Streptomyces abyssalis TaxID=933944 RepID=UPI00085C9A13|nr:glycine betaine ABC transporter substrate-binding protein [Streptomyces abyssalis]